MHLLKLAKSKFSTYKYMSYDKNQLTVTGIFRFVTITGTVMVMIIIMIMIIIMMIMIMMMLVIMIIIIITIYLKNLGKKDKNI